MKAVPTHQWAPHLAYNVFIPLSDYKSERINAEIFDDQIEKLRRAILLNFHGLTEMEGRAITTAFGAENVTLMISIIPAEPLETQQRANQFFQEQAESIIQTLAQAEVWVTQSPLRVFGLNSPERRVVSDLVQCASMGKLSDVLEFLKSILSPSMEAALLDYETGAIDETIGNLAYLTHLLLSNSSACPDALRRQELIALAWKLTKLLQNPQSR